ncbi:MAG: glycosyltransferase family 39 protein [Tepidisphaeraceae bacterium]
MWWALYLVFLQAAGYALVSRLARHRSRLEIAGLSACLGPGVFGLCLVFLSMLGLRPGRAEVLILGSLAVIAAAISLYKRKGNDAIEPPEVQRPSARLWTGACLVAIAYGAVAVAADVAIYPTMEWDAFGIWQLKGEVLAKSALAPRPAYFENLNLSYSHLRYPVLAPMMSAGVHALTGRLGDDGQKTPAMLLYLGLVAVVYSTIRRGSGHLAAITVTTMFADLPVFFRYAGSGTAEMALATFYGGSVACLLRWWKQRDWSNLVLTALFSACMAWTKNEGQALAGINAGIFVCLALSRRQWAQCAAFLAIVFILFSPWLIYIRNLPRTDEDYTGRLNLRELVSHVDRVPVIVRGTVRAMAKWIDTGPQRLTAPWGMFWFVLAVVAIAGWRRFQRGEVVLLWILLGLHLLVYVPPYMVTPWNLQGLMNTTIDRLLMHAAPVGAMLMGAMWGPAD